MPRLLTAALLALLVAGCAKIPEDRYGVRRVHIEGMEDLDEYALRACLATQERENFTIDLGATSEPDCGAPPFDGRRVHMRLWHWPWSEWPTYDMAVLERDLERIER